MSALPPNNSIKVQSEVKQKKCNTAATSRESFSSYNASGKRVTEREKALMAIDEYQPVTSRQLATLMQVERCHITRCIYDLMQAGRVRISHTAKCQVTGRRVQHYCLTGWQPSLFNQ